MRYFAILLTLVVASVEAMAADAATTIEGAATNRLGIKPAFTKKYEPEFTTRAYEKESLRLVIREANQVAEQLRLHENLPITESNLIQFYITPFGMSKMIKAIGNVATTNYAYYMSVGGKFSYLEGTHQEADLSRWPRKDWWPISRLDTNGAYRLAAEWLKEVSMDVDGLNNDCNLHVQPAAVRGQGANASFLPVYWVYWTRGEKGHGSVASVKFSAPTKTLMQLRVENSDYILRQPLRFTNLNALLSDPSKP